MSDESEGMWEVVDAAYWHVHEGTEGNKLQHSQDLNQIPFKCESNALLMCCSRGTQPFRQVGHTEIYNML